VPHLALLSNIIEQDHRAVKRRSNAKRGFRSFDDAWRTLQGYEAIRMIGKHKCGGYPRETISSQVMIIHQILGFSIP
jgi:transposase, IS6 family